MKNKEKKKAAPILPTLLLLLIGGACGFLCVQFFPDGMYDLPFPQFAGALLLFLLALYLAFFIHIAAHEVGHLVFGLLSGYRFSSYRLGGLMLLHDGERLRFARLSLAGTGGQCLMIPPEEKDGRIPVLLYNLGGALMNLILSLISFLVWIPLREHSYVAALLMLFVIVGIMQAAINGIPMRLGMVDNDGYNAFAIRKDLTSMRAFRQQLLVNAAITHGKRLSEMPDTYFALPEDADLKNSMVAAIAVFACNRLMDEGRYAEADGKMQELLEADTGMADLHRYLLLCDRILCALLDRRGAEAKALWEDKGMQRFVKQMRRFPTVIRTVYAVARLGTGDARAAEKAAADFEKCARRYPYPADIASERALMALCDPSRFS